MKGLKYFERIVIWSLVAMLVIIILCSLIQVAAQLFVTLFTSPKTFFDVDHLFDMLSSVFMVLIGMELFETVKMYIQKKGIYVELIIDVAIIALARKIIIFEYDCSSVNLLYAVGVAMVSLGIVRYICKKTSTHCEACETRRQLEKEKGESHEAHR